MVEAVFQRTTDISACAGKDTKEITAKVKRETFCEVENVTKMNVSVLEVFHVAWRGPCEKVRMFLWFLFFFFFCFRVFYIEI